MKCNLCPEESKWKENSIRPNKYLYYCGSCRKAGLKFGFLEKEELKRC